MALDEIDSSEGSSFSILISEKFSLILIKTGIASIAVLLLCFCYKAVLFNFDVPIKAEIFGQFGDVVGGFVGSLWALAGVMLFYIGLKEQRKDTQTSKKALEKQIEALNLQQKELKLQRKEMELTRIEAEMSREVLNHQKEAVREQVNISRTQQFEAHLYSLLNIYIRIRHDLESEKNFLNEVNAQISEVTGRLMCDSRNKMEVIRAHYSDVYFKNKDKISHYLKIIYRIFRIIDEQKSLSDEQKFFYAKIVRSQLTEQELYLIYYNANSEYGKNFRTLITKYNLLKHLMLISKVEFLKFNSENIQLANKRQNFVSWLDEFLSDRISLLYDIEVESPRFSSSYPLYSPEKIIAELLLDGEENICIRFLDNLSVIESYLEMNIEFGEFIEHYCYDRMFNCNFLELDEKDTVEIHIDNNTVVVVVKTDQDVNIISDAA